MIKKQTRGIASRQQLNIIKIKLPLNMNQYLFNTNHADSSTGVNKNKTEFLHGY